MPGIACAKTGSRSLAAPGSSCSRSRASSLLSFSICRIRIKISIWARLRPAPGHWLGTDTLGRDLLARILYGGRISLMVGLVASLVALIIGVSYGAIAGFFGGTVDAIMMRLVDIMYALPFTIFVILMMVFLKEPMQAVDAWLAHFSLLSGLQGVGKILLLFAAIGAVEWLTMARIVRGQILSIKRMEYIEAARALGLSRRRIIFRHMIPNILGPVVVYTTLTIPAVMLLESFLSFLGLGVDAPMSSWGTLIKDGAEKMEEFWWLLVFPGGVFSLTLFSLEFPRRRAARCLGRSRVERLKWKTLPSKLSISSAMPRPKAPCCCSYTAPRPYPWGV